MLNRLSSGGSQGGRRVFPLIRRHASTGTDVLPSTSSESAGPNPVVLQSKKLVKERTHALETHHRYTRMPKHRKLDADRLRELVSERKRKLDVMRGNSRGDFDSTFARMAIAEGLDRDIAWMLAEDNQDPVFTDPSQGTYHPENYTLQAPRGKARQLYEELLANPVKATDLSEAEKDLLDEHERLPHPPAIDRALNEEDVIHADRHEGMFAGMNPQDELARAFPSAQINPPRRPPPLSKSKDWRALAASLTPHNPPTGVIDPTQLNPNDLPLPYNPSSPPQTEPHFSATLLHGRSILAPLQHPQTHSIPAASLQLRSHNPKLLELFSHFALHAASALGIPASNSVKLPIKRTMWTVTKSAFVHKKAQENFERRVHARAIKCWDADPEIVDRWVAYLEGHVLGGVGMRVVRWERAPVGVGRERERYVKGQLVKSLGIRDSSGARAAAVGAESEGEEGEMHLGPQQRASSLEIRALVENILDSEKKARGEQDALAAREERRAALFRHRATSSAREDAGYERTEQEENVRLETRTEADAHKQLQAELANLSSSSLSSPPASGPTPEETDALVAQHYAEKEAHIARLIEMLQKGEVGGDLGEEVMKEAERLVAEVMADLCVGMPKRKKKRVARLNEPSVATAEAGDGVDAIPEPEPSALAESAEEPPIDDIARLEPAAAVRIETSTASSTDPSMSGEAKDNVVDPVPAPEPESPSSDEAGEAAPVEPPVATAETTAESGATQSEINSSASSSEPKLSAEPSEATAEAKANVKVVDPVPAPEPVAESTNEAAEAAPVEPPVATSETTTESKTQDEFKTSAQPAASSSEPEVSAGPKVDVVDPVPAPEPGTEATGAGAAPVEPPVAIKDVQTEAKEREDGKES